MREERSVVEIPFGCSRCCGRVLITLASKDATSEQLKKFVFICPCQLMPGYHLEWIQDK